MSELPKTGPGARADDAVRAQEERLLTILGLSPEDRAEIASLGDGPQARLALERAVSRRALADRLSSVTALAAGVAHELNNPLAYVTANLAFLAERTGRLVALLSGAAPHPEDADLVGQVHDAMREARSGAERMRAVVRDLKTFARGEEERCRPVDVRPVLDSCVNVAWTEIRRRAQLVRHLEPVPPVLGDEARLSQLFLNLVLNAAQSIPEGRPDDHEIEIATRTRPDGRIAIEVRDSGSGIAPGLLPRIFDPFFTTKSPGCGTGLGLSICHAVVCAMGGEIEVESTVGEGSTFRVLLAPAPAAAGAERGSPRRSGRPARASSSWTTSRSSGPRSAARSSSTTTSTWSSPRRRRWSASPRASGTTSSSATCSCRG